MVSGLRATEEEEGSGCGKDVPEGRDGVAEREERVGSGLRCGEANPNQWGVEPSHWGGPQG